MLGCAGGDSTEVDPREAPAADSERRTGGGADDERSESGESRRFPPVEAELRNVDFEAAPGIVLRIRRLRGQLVPTEPDRPPVFDQPHSFRLRVAEGEVAIDADSLRVLVDEHVFGPEHPVRQVEVSFEQDRLVVEGNLRKVVPIPFHMEARPRVAEGGGILLEPAVLKSAGLPVKGLLELFGLELVEMMNADEARGIEVRDDRMILHPRGVLPPPRLDGSVTAVAVEDGLLVQRLGPLPAPQSRGDLSTAPLEPPRRAVPNYQLFRGGVLRFGHLTMEPADLMLVDADPEDPFLFSLARYQRQLVAGYSKTLPDGGLVTRMPDADEAEPSDLDPR